MKISAAIFGLFMASTVSGFQQNPARQHQSKVGGLYMLEEQQDGEVSRRSMIKNVGAAFAAISIQSFTAASSRAGLLDEYGSDPKQIKDPSIEAEAKRKKEAAIVASKKAEVDYEPNLRSNYYYPTNKKRYLPRIKKCNDAIPDAAAMIGNEDWEGAEQFAVKIADDTILPMKLYTSSLLGGGTNVKVSFAKDMNQAG